MKRVLLLLLLASPTHAMVIDPVDPAFGVATIEVPSPAGRFPVRLEDVAVLPDDGGVVLAATLEQSDPVTCSTVTLYWFTAAGAAAGSKVVVPCAIGVALGAASDGTLYLAGQEGSYASRGPIRVWKLTPNGVVDPTFTGTIPRISSFWKANVEVLADGTVAVGGTAVLMRGDIPYNALVVAHLRQDGTPDPAYGVQGIAVAEPPNRPIFGQVGGGMAHNADGSVLVAGNIFEDDAGPKAYTDATVVRFDAHGKVDPSYGQAGFAIPMPDASTYVQRLAVRNGEAYVTVVQNRDLVTAWVGKLRASGALDLTYGVNGIAQLDDYYNSNFHPVIALDTQGRAYVQYLDRGSHSKIVRFDAQGLPDASFGLSGAAYLAGDGWRLTGPGKLVAQGDQTYFGAGVSRRDGTTDRWGIGATRLASHGGHRANVTAGMAIVYYNASLNHYFLTANPAEQALLDNGITKGWQRAGESFGVVTSALPDPDLTPVCRFYGRPEAHLDSHFFSAAPDECAAVAAKFGASWILETSAAFYVHPADPVTGKCPRGSEQVVRAFNNRADANHYYGVFYYFYGTPHAPPGWTYEGYGPPPYPTAFCAPLI